MGDFKQSFPGVEEVDFFAQYAPVHAERGYNPIGRIHDGRSRIIIKIKQKNPSVRLKFDSERRFVRI
ncbi:hypothetical protein SAMN05444390_10924 [Marinobacterium lutimaris]|uniref:Uncharacterized protein n=1 Tax=Marinobacterium lutimaris TaxID=568106 RepID=A0A1H6DTL5_9GAMM|nr:hypothetical protein SAMN05444390_10924 [Marinobacterium lutimaris]